MADKTFSFKEFIFADLGAAVLWDVIKDGLKHLLKKGGEEVVRKTTEEHRAELFAFIGTTLRSVRHPASDYAADTLLRRHRERQLKQLSYQEGDEAKFVDLLTKLFMALQAPEEREARFDIFIELALMSDQEFDVALEFLNHDSAFQWTTRLWKTQGTRVRQFLIVVRRWWQNTIATARMVVRFIAIVIPAWATVPIAMSMREASAGAIAAATLSPLLVLVALAMWRPLSLATVFILATTPNYRWAGTWLIRLIGWELFVGMTAAVIPLHHGKGVALFAVLAVAIAIFLSDWGREEFRPIAKKLAVGAALAALTGLVFPNFGQWAWDLPGRMDKKFATWTRSTPPTTPGPTTSSATSPSPSTLPASPTPTTVASLVLKCGNVLDKRLDGIRGRVALQVPEGCWTNEVRRPTITGPDGQKSWADKFATRILQGQSVLQVRVYEDGSMSEPFLDKAGVSTNGSGTFVVGRRFQAPAGSGGVTLHLVVG